MADESVIHRRAVALRYKQDLDDAPRVVGKGRGKLAEKIIALAEEHDVPLYEDPDLVQVLSTLEFDQEIPPKLYQAVAEVLAFVYRINQKYAVS